LIVSVFTGPASVELLIIHIGAVWSISKGLIIKEELLFHAESVTMIVQLECVPSVRELNVIRLSAVIAAVVELEQSHPYSISQSSLEPKI
jgi:hypothetical protein